MTVTPELLANAERWAEHFATIDPAEAPTARPQLGVAIVACMDARIDTFAIFGLGTGDSHIIRNAGGLVTDDTIRSLAVSQRFLGTREIILLHHTECGLMDFDDDKFAAELERETGQRPTWRAGGFTDPLEDVRRSIEVIRQCPFIPWRDRVRGFVYDVATGRLEEGVPDTTFPTL